MAKYVYPAVFTPEEGGSYSVNFPDIDGCFTFGESLPDAITMAEDVLALMLYDREANDENIPAASAIGDVPHNAGEFVSYIAADTLVYRRRFNNKAVKKTLSIPEWLNELAIAADVNFSQELQDALKKRLGVA